MSMDKVFKIDEKPYISPIINLRKFLAEGTTQQNSVKQFFGIPTTTTEESDQPSNSALIPEHEKKFTQFMIDRGFNIEDANKAIKNGE